MEIMQHIIKQQYDLLDRSFIYHIAQQTANYTEHVKQHSTIAYAAGGVVLTWLISVAT